MIIILLLAALAILVVLSVIDDDWEDVILSTFFGLIVIAIINVLLCITGGDDNAHAKIRSVDTQQVVSLNDGPGTSGSISGGFLFFAGQINGNLSYSWYSKQDNGSFAPHNISTNNSEVHVHEVSKNEEARVVVTRYDTEFDISNWLTVFDWNILGYYNDNAYDLYVPRGTITQGDFKLDAK